MVFTEEHENVNARNAGNILGWDAADEVLQAADVGTPEGTPGAVAGSRSG